MGYHRRAIKGLPGGSTKEKRKKEEEGNVIQKITLKIVIWITIIFKDNPVCILEGNQDYLIISIAIKKSKYNNIVGSL